MNELDQHHFDSMVPRKPFFSVRETADFLGVGSTMVEKLIESGRLLCHEYNAGRGLRMTRRIPRQGVILHLLKTKTYAIEDYLSGVIGLLSALSAPELGVIREYLPKLMARATGYEPSGEENLNP